MSSTTWSRGRTLGRGSSATVSLASSAFTGVFAVKSAELSSSGALQRERQILSALDSPNIISYLGFDVKSDPADRRVYYNLFIEYAPGGSLSDEIRKRGGRLDEPAIKARTHDVLAGLSYLHDKQLVHCDIKGANILIGADGGAKIADLGCAKSAATGDAGGEISGTPMFMAPEVARGEKQGPEADVWALGCAVIEMATGKAPWPEVSSSIAVLHKIAFSSEVPETPNWLSDEAKDFLSRCLARDAGERWTAEQLLKHPFMASAAKLGSHLDLIDKTWVSPKSTLDQYFWDSFTEAEEDETEDETWIENPNLNPADRIRELAASGSASMPPNWTRAYDDDWITVRSNNDSQYQNSSNPTSAADTVVLRVSRSNADGEFEAEDLSISSRDDMIVSVVNLNFGGEEEGNFMDKEPYSFCIVCDGNSTSINSESFQDILLVHSVLAVSNAIVPIEFFFITLIFTKTNWCLFLFVRLFAFLRCFECLIPIDG